MAAKKEDPKAAPAGDAKAEEPKKKLPIKTIGLVAGVMVVEAVVVFMIFKAIAPKTTKAQEHAEVVNSDAETIKELKAVEDKFQNVSEGRAWIWDVSVVVQVRKKHSDSVEKTLKSREAEIRQGIGLIIAKLEHAQLKSAEREALTRQATAFLQRLVGNDEKTNEPMIERVLIPRCRGFPSEF
jgi:flagellar basal body-associated protein FliL